MDWRGDIQSACCVGAKRDELPGEHLVAVPRPGRPVRLNSRQAAEAWLVWCRLIGVSGGFGVFWGLCGPGFWLAAVRWCEWDIGSHFELKKTTLPENPGPDRVRGGGNRNFLPMARQELPDVIEGAMCGCSEMWCRPQSTARHDAESGPWSGR